MVQEELSSGHPRIVDEGAVNGAAGLLEAESNLLRVTPSFLRSIVENLFDTEICEPIGAVSLKLRITENGASDTILFPLCRGTLGFALTDYDRIDSGGHIIGIFVIES